MADHEQRALVGTQMLEQPVARVGIEMVRGLVEQQQVAAGEQDARKFQPASFTTRERAHGEVEAGIVEADARHDSPRLGLGGVAAQALELLLGLAEGADGRVGAVLLHRDGELREAVGGHVEIATGQHTRQAVRVRRGLVGTGIL
jgi:hypothetical protein